MTGAPIDTDFIHLPDGRGVGRLLPNKARMRMVAPFPAVALPEAQWVDFEDETPLTIKDQDGKGACNGHAAATALEYARWLGGYPHVPLSAWYVYAILCNGIDRGSMILDALELSVERGVCAEPLVPYGVINPRRLSDEAHADAKRFKIEIGGRLQTWSDIVGAVQLHHGINLSLRAGPGFDRLDSEGVPSFASGAGNHAVFVGGGAKKSTKHGWLVRMRNSWGTRWGQDGCCWLSEACWKRQSYKEAYSIAAVEADPNDPTNPPDVRP